MPPRHVGLPAPFYPLNHTFYVSVTIYYYSTESLCPHLHLKYPSPPIPFDPIRFPPMEPPQQPNPPTVLMVESQPPPPPPPPVGGDAPPPTPRKKTPLNKYALACALLASASSVLLGYGGFPFISFFLFQLKNFGM